ncbi:MAG: FHA domain-containing protein [Tannerellaceae bacterium]|nr:FHA domain-containing protein [Tannerellaceae bacterium]
MISLRCPHCNVGLQVKEEKIPEGRETFNCPRCKQAIPVTVLKGNTGQDFSVSSETVLLQPRHTTSGQLTVMPSPDHQEQVFPLSEGVFIVGRKSTKPSNARIGIVTTDKSMSREHIRIEVKKDQKNGFQHLLSDSNSKNHTLYNSNYLQDGEVVVLKDKDEIIIGRTILRFNV